MRPFYDPAKQNPRKSPDLKRRRLYLSNLPDDVLNEEVMRLLSDVVAVEEVVVPRDANGHGRGYGFAYLKNEADVEQAMSHLDLSTLRGRQIRVTRELQLDPENRRPLTLQEKRDHLALMRRKMLASLF